MKPRGFTLIELLVVITIIGTLAGLVTHLVTSGHRERNKIACTHNVRQLVGLLETAGGSRYPAHGGASLAVYLVRRGELEGSDGLKTLFCPGDLAESFEGAGGEAAYAALDADAAAGHLTSYAFRDLGDRACVAAKGAARAVVLVADDSEDHHDARGLVVGLTGGAVRWRDKIDDYGVARDAPLRVGPDAGPVELRCLRSDD